MTHAEIAITIPLSARREATTLDGEIVQPAGPPVERQYGQRSPIRNYSPSDKFMTSTLSLWARRRASIMTVVEHEIGLGIIDPNQPTIISRATLAAKDTTRNHRVSII